MAKVKLKVVGKHEVAGVKRPNTVELDDEQYHIRALEKAGHVQRVQDRPAPQSSQAKKE